MDRPQTVTPVQSTSLVKAKHLSIREEEVHLTHRKLLGIGGFGEVHEVRRFSRGFADSDKVV